MSGGLLDSVDMLGLILLKKRKELEYLEGLEFSRRYVLTSMELITLFECFYLRI